LSTAALEVKIVYPPPNTTCILQPIDQEAISTFKAYYLWVALKGFAEAIHYPCISNREWDRDIEGNKTNVLLKNHGEELLTENN
jgi:hypothetical protein